MEPIHVDDGELQDIRSGIRLALTCGAIVLLAIGFTFSTLTAPPLLIAFAAWLGQVISSMRAASRAKRALENIARLRLPVDMAVQDQLRAMRRSALIIGVLGIIGGGIVFLLGGLVVVALGSLAGAWGRPLRAGKQNVGATIGERGHRWAEGPRPRVDSLDEATRQALGRMWLHDAQKEHGSVPAFAQLTWQLATLGAPSSLLERCHHAALQEIEHTRRCFALSETYLGRSLHVGPIEGVPGQLSFPRSRRRIATRVALETLEDGCLIEDLNADFAERAAAIATDPAAKMLATTIAIEEREHAELAWDILRWCIELDPRVRAAVGRKLHELPMRVLVPYSMQTMQIIGRAQPQALQEHGRVPLEEWIEIYALRRAATVDRVEAMLADRVHQAASDDPDRAEGIAASG